MNRIKEYRQKYGYSQAQLAALCQVAQGTISGWELGKYEPDYSLSEKLANLFDTTVDDLFGKKVQTDSQLQPVEQKFPPLSDEAIQLAQKYMLLNPSAQAVLRTVAEYELRQDTYMRTELEGMRIDYEKQLDELRQQLPEVLQA